MAIFQTRSANALDAPGIAHAALLAALRDSSEIDLSWISPPPSEDGWTLAPDALRFLSKIIRHARPRHVLEFGSGLSTRLLKRSCDRESLNTSISSIDHDPQFGNLSQNLISGALSQQIAPIVARDYGGKLLPTYLLEPRKFASLEPVDLALIDGPPVTLGGREGTLYQVMDVARPGTLVLLDDADRAAERMALVHWEQTLGDAIEIYRPAGFTKGLAVILIHRVIPSAELWAQRLSQARRLIQQIVPIDQRLILVDDNYWGTDLGRDAVPFIERNGISHGAPLNDEQALVELRRHQLRGTRYLAFLWPACWWLDYYVGLAHILRTRFRCVESGDLLTCFDLK